MIENAFAISVIIIILLFLLMLLLPLFILVIMIKVNNIEKEIKKSNKIKKDLLIVLNNKFDKKEK